MTTIWIGVTAIGLVLVGLAVWPSFRDRNRSSAAGEAPRDSAAEAEAARHASDRYSKGDGGVGGGSI